MKNNSNIACSSTLSCQSFSPLLFIRYAPPAFCAPVEEWGNRPKWEFKLKIDWRVGLLPIPCAGILSVGCVVLWSCTCCFPAGSWTYVMSNGNTKWASCSMVRASAPSCLVPVETGLTVWPVTFWYHCLGRKKAVLKKFFFIFFTFVWRLEEKQSAAADRQKTAL